MAVSEIQFANFVCKFGDKPMRALLEEVVLPAFTDDKLTRSAGDDTYFHLYDVKLSKIQKDGKDRHIIFGRFIKNTRISRDQYFDNSRGLVRDHRALRSSPSAFFVLIVENHRLLYLSETVGAPEISSFAATMRKFISDKHLRWIDGTYETAKAERHQAIGSNKPDRVTKKSLFERTPRPRVDIISLSDPTDIESFLERYNRLRRVEFKIIDTNDEMDAGELFQTIRDTFSDLHSTQTKLVSTNPKGLDIDAAKEITKEATKGGYQEVRFNGQDADGNRLIGDNDSFALRSTLEDPPTDDALRARAMVDRFDQLRDDGRIVAPDGDADLDEEKKGLFND